MEFYHSALQDRALSLVKGPVLSTPWKTLSMYLNATVDGKTREIPTISKKLKSLY